ncbi:MAG TPA: hypothetical protein VNA15_04880 [Candidatus Angelobacter sp.]|nr:hypothetical protein [Candidatus Angelobacter sp.]
MLTYQLTYAFSDKLLTILKHPPHLGQRPHGDEKKTLVRLNELQLRTFTYTILFAYSHRNRNHALAGYSRNLTQTDNTIQATVKPYN